MIRRDIDRALDKTYESLPETAARGHPLYRGKVRDLIRGAGRLLLVASDRLSAFDRVLSTVPFKGEVLSRISAWWFERTRDILDNHILPGGSPTELPGLGRATLAAEARMIDIELVVRGYLSGSAWRDYASGRLVSGIALPQGLRRNEKFPQPIITPSLKVKDGHDMPLSCARILDEKIVEPDLWFQIEKAALALFLRGQELAATRGLILVDTKYEFGLLDGKLILADELHSPDSSRFWQADSYRPLFAAGEEQRELDKEPFRRWLADQGFCGEGKAPAIPDSIRAETAWRYVQAYEAITGENFEPRGSDPQSENLALERIVAERLG